MSKTWISGLGLTVLATVFLPPVHGQAQNDPTVKAEGQLVSVDVVARGGGGAALRRDDFQIFDNGQQQKIALFDVVSGATNAATAITLPAGVVSNRRDSKGAIPSSATIILIDRINTPTDAQVDVNRQLREVIGALEAKEGIALYELRSDGLRVVHDYTGDPKDLEAGVAALETEHSLSLGSSTRPGGFESELENVGLDPQLNEIRTGNTGFDRSSADYFLNDRALRTSAALETIARHMEGVRGRRNLIWLSGRFPFSFDVWSRTDLRAEVVDSTMKQIEDVGILLNNANIAIYPVDVRGPGGEGSEITGVAQEIARATGGRAFRTNAIDEAVQAALADSRRVYKLGFYPSQPGKDRGKRSLRVEARGPGSGLELLYRPRYEGFGKSNQPATRVGVAELLSSSLDATGIGMTAMAAPAQGSPGVFELVTLVDIADLHLVQRADRWEGALVVGLVFRNDKDGTAYVIPPTTDKINLTRQQYEAFQKTGLVLQRFLNTEGRQGVVRIAVQDPATGSAGSLWVPVGTKK